MKKISIIIPTLNEEKQIERCLASVRALHSRGHEIIVVDGGSEDETCSQVKDLADKIIPHSRGRATQMNVGAHAACGEIFIFLHADTCLPDDADTYINDELNEDIEFWGRFNVRLSGRHWLFRIIEICMNMRTRITGIVTGDHAIFMSKTLYNNVGGFPEIALMEDIAISSKLKHIVHPVCLKQSVVTSSRRWEENGIIKTILKMWWLRLAFFLGSDPLTLARQYD
ncbi:MAG: TIGR04283 family arsenosugar biosynthesis glycosyltransferase [Gammaproteobacteria bacterium]